MGKKNCQVQAAYHNSTINHPKQKRTRGLNKFDNLTGIFTNADTLTNKMAELLALVKEHNPDIIGVNEVLSKSFKHQIFPEEFAIENYEMIAPPTWRQIKGVGLSCTSVSPSLIERLVLKMYNLTRVSILK